MMNTRTALNLLAFQTAWFACIGGAAAGWDWIGPVGAAAAAAMHLRLTRRDERPQEIAYLSVAALGGTLVDAALCRMKVTVYGGGQLTGLWYCPLWMSALWLVFATTIRGSLSWLRGRVVLAALFGAVGGPLAYWAGARLRALSLGEPANDSLLAVGITWAIATPLMFRLSDWLHRAPSHPMQSSTRPMIGVESRGERDTRA